jgi:D-glycero-alpha-D-manno-heptose-7-phosphate kinase
VEEIQHPIFREALTLHPVGPAVEIASFAGIPAGTGLGSSGAFTVGLLKTLYAFNREHVTAADLAEEACHIEIDRLRYPVGKQDQYIAAHGGIQCLEFLPDGRTKVFPLAISTETMHDLEERMLMFFTGYSRHSTEVLRDQKERSEAGDAAMLDGLHMVKKLGQESKEALESGDTIAYAKLMHEHWLYKRERSPGISSPEIDRLYEVGLRHGAIGGKLVGAGAGGFLIFYTEDVIALRTAMLAEGLPEQRFRFDHDGSVVVVRSG